MDGKFAKGWEEAGLSDQSNLPDQVKLLKLLEETTEDIFKSSALFESQRHVLGTKPERIRSSGRESPFRCMTAAARARCSRLLF